MTDGVEDYVRDALSILNGELGGLGEFAEQSHALNLVVALLWIVDAVMEPEAEIEEQGKPSDLCFDISIIALD